MKLSEATELIKDELAGRRVDIEIDTTVIKGFLTRALYRVRDWYEEPEIFETVDIEGTSEFRYVMKSSLSRTPHVMRDMYTTNPVSVTTASVEADLLGLSGYRIIDEPWMEVDVFEKQLGIGLDQYFSVMPQWREIQDRYLIEGSSITDTITVKYTPYPEKIQEVTVDKAIELIIEWALAKSKISLGRVRSKFEGSDLEFTTDGKDLIQEGNEFIREFQDRLERLDFSLSGSRRY